MMTSWSIRQQQASSGILPCDRLFPDYSPTSLHAHILRAVLATMKTSINVSIRLVCN
jgi:hypothetical protein